MSLLRRILPLKGGGGVKVVPSPEDFVFQSSHALRDAGFYPEILGSYVKLDDRFSAEMLGTYVVRAT